MKFEKMLVDALQSKNKIIIEEAFQLIYDSYFKLVYFCISNYVHNKEDIEELTNDVFLKFFNHLDNIKIDGSIKYYLTTSAKNTAINFSKKQNKIVLSDTIEATSGVENKYHDNELMNKIKKHLTEEETNLIIEHVVIGKSLKEIADENKLNANTIKSKYRRALFKLRKALGGEKHE